MLAASKSSKRKRRRFLQPMQQSATANAEPGKIGLEPWRRAAVAEDVATVSVVDVVPGGVTVCGEKLHDAPAGNPDEQLNDTGESNPYSGVTVIVVVPLCPTVTVSDAGEGATEKSEGMVYVAEATALAE